MLAKALAMNDILPGAQCTTMSEVRAGVDQVDRELITLLVRRFAYMDAAARIKPERDHVRDEARKAQVIANARAAGDAAGLPADSIAALWENLVEASIAYELEAFDRREVLGRFLPSSADNTPRIVLTSSLVQAGLVSIVRSVRRDVGTRAGGK